MEAEGSGGGGAAGGKAEFEAVLGTIGQRPKDTEVCRVHRVELRGSGSIMDGGSGRRQALRALEVS